MSSALERLKQLAQEKKANESTVPSNSPDPVVDSNSSVHVEETNHASDTSGTVHLAVSPDSSSGSDSPSCDGKELASESTGQCGASNSGNEAVPSSPDNSSVDIQRSSPSLADDHPIIMKLAELEQALLESLPDFRTILRDIHAKLRQDPMIVTAMSPEQVGVVVRGLMHHAQVEVLAPKAVKASKKAAKTPINAGDL